MNDPIAERGKRLFEYFTALTNLRTIHVLDFKQYEESFFLNEIPRKPGCQTLLWGINPDEESDNWIEIKKPKRKALPISPEELALWVNQAALADSDCPPPEPLQKIVAPGQDDKKRKDELLQFLSWDQQKHLHSMYQKYIQEKWIPWAQEDRNVVDIQRVFAKLYAIHQKQQRVGETYEVVLGFGVLKWKSGTRVLNRHVLTTPCTVEFDLKREI